MTLALSVSFATPLALLGLLALPPLAAGYVVVHRRRRRAADAFATPALRPAVAPWDPGWRRHFPIALFGAALAVLVVALARPQRGVAVPVERATVMLVTDESTSMRATDVDPTRLEAARAAASAFLDDVPARLRVGLVTFSTYPQLAAPPSTDHDA
ncbi:MAG TPA: VWA domain-containing protein, partial [Solirubrobacteraceae bacterium]|nr:VWA domain-containing protein [Solirubrobacteraceae bacterium]